MGLKNAGVQQPVQFVPYGDTHPYAPENPADAPIQGPIRYLERDVKAVEILSSPENTWKLNFGEDADPNPANAWTVKSTPCPLGVPLGAMESHLQPEPPITDGSHEVGWMVKDALNQRADEMFNMLDANGDGVIQRSEFIERFRELSASPVREESPPRDLSLERKVHLWKGVAGIVNSPGYNAYNHGIPVPVVAPESSLGKVEQALDWSSPQIRNMFSVDSNLMREANTQFKPHHNSMASAREMVNELKRQTMEETRRQQAWEADLMKVGASRGFMATVPNPSRGFTTPHIDSKMTTVNRMDHTQVRPSEAQPSSVDKIFEALDVNGDGVIDRKEFINALRNNSLDLDSVGSATPSVYSEERATYASSHTSARRSMMDKGHIESKPLNATIGLNSPVTPYRELNTALREHQELQHQHNQVRNQYSSYLHKDVENAYVKDENRVIMVPRDPMGSDEQGFQARSISPTTALKLQDAESKHRAAMQRHLDAMNRHMKVVEDCKKV